MSRILDMTGHEPSEVPQSGVCDHGRQDFKAELSALEIFKDVPGSLMDQITPELQEFFPDRTPLFHEGDPADKLLLILHGQVCISAGGRAGSVRDHRRTGAYQPDETNRHCASARHGSSIGTAATHSAIAPC